LECRGASFWRDMAGGKFDGSRPSSVADNDRHLMTGTGAYFYLVWGIWLRHCLNYRQDEYELLWPNWMTMPVVVKQQKPFSNGHTAGSAGKATKKTL
jgi:hypothetical protein